MNLQPTILQPTIFLVDDDPAVRDALSLFLETAGFIVESYSSGNAFLEAYTLDRPGCLVLDLCMPNMNGLELQKGLHLRKIRIPIIFISGHDDKSVSSQALEAGAIAFLEKPFHHQLLLDRIEEAIVQDARIRQGEMEKTANLARFTQLTTLEQDMMRLIVAGESEAGIATKLGISRNLVQPHRTRILKKMRAESLPDLVTMAVACGIHELPRRQE